MEVWSPQLLFETFFGPPDLPSLKFTSLGRARRVEFDRAPHASPTVHVSVGPRSEKKRDTHYRSGATITRASIMVKLKMPPFYCGTVSRIHG